MSFCDGLKIWGSDITGPEAGMGSFDRASTVTAL